MGWGGGRWAGCGALWRAPEQRRERLARVGPVGRGAAKELALGFAAAAKREDGLEAAERPEEAAEAGHIAQAQPGLQLALERGRLGVRPRGCRLRAVLQAQLAHCAR